MNFESKWIPIEELGSGGQGVVYLVHKNYELETKKPLDDEIHDSIYILSVSHNSNQIDETTERFKKAINQIIQESNPQNHFALKKLQTIESAKDPDKSIPRIKNEIEAMAKFSHPNLLKIIDYDIDDYWFVSEYHIGGTLEKNMEIFKGNVHSTLKAIKPLVEGVKLLHNNNIIHRDIKPENIFIATDGRLVLGDFGLVFFKDEERDRLSGTFESVGSTHWMPPWVFGIRKRIEEVNPTFDIYSLGKLMWSMISGIPVLQLWYYYKDDNNLEKMFPNDPNMRLINQLFKNCIVEEEKDCFSDAGVLLDKINELILYLDLDIGIIGDDNQRMCKVCGNGYYNKYIDRDSNKIASFFGHTFSTINHFRIYACNNCGHIQLFHFPGGQETPAWRKNK